MSLLLLTILTVLVLTCTANSCMNDEESPLYCNDDNTNDDIYITKVLGLPYDEVSLVIMVDFQHDFCDKEYGSLVVNGCSDAIEYANELIEHLPDYVTFITTGDAHTHDDHSFASTHGVDPDFVELWTDHCVEGTPGIELDNRLNIRNDTLHFSKTQYSVVTQDMKNYIEDNNITHVIIVGVAGEVCVDASIKDFLDMNIEVSFHLPAIGFLDNNNQEIYEKSWLDRGANNLPFF